MKQYLEQINKFLLQLALALLVFRNGSFGASGIPKLFESCMIVLVLLTAAHLVLNRKVGEFFAAIPRKIWGALGIFYGTTILGWILAVTIFQIPSTTNMVYEIGMFSVAVVTFLLILFYSRNDREYVYQCFYSLLIPGLFVIFAFLPGVAYRFGLARDAAFNGFADNVEIVCKLLLIPAMYFIVQSISKGKHWWYRALYIVIAIAMTTLVIWTTQRAALLALIVASGVVWLLTIQKQWKRAVLNAVILVVIAVLGFLLVPQIGKKASVNRVLNTDAKQSNYEQIKEKTVVELIEESAVVSDTKVDVADTEPRVRIWGYYINKTIEAPFGLGPNTHMEATISHPRRTFVNPGPHNTYLQAWLWGGVLGLLSIVYILIVACKRLYERFRETQSSDILAVLGALVAFSIAIFFNDNLPSYWWWALLAISQRI